MRQVRVAVPATSANLGPGFDCLALALDLWNEAVITPGGKDLQVVVSGEGAGSLPSGKENLVYQAYLQTLKFKNTLPTTGLSIQMQNRIPIGSGLGSSASAVVMGVLAAKHLHELDLTQEEMIALCVDLEGHGDNAAAAMLGGLVVLLQESTGWFVRKFKIPTINAVVVLPEVHFPTREARQALPDSIPHNSAVFNISRSILTVEAFRTGDLVLLGKVMEDRLHEPYRLKLIPGAEKAITAARNLGAASTLSGAGPGIIAFCSSDHRNISKAIQNQFHQAGIPTRSFSIKSTNRSARVM
jgi:homoserine kinase